MPSPRLQRLLLLLIASLLFPVMAGAQDKAVVRAVLFYSPTCPHCHKVLQEGLPPIIEKYGDQLEILLVNVQTPGGQQLYQSAREWLPIPDDKLGVPAMIIGRELLLGDVEIPARLPDLIENGLAQGGVDWPQIPGLAEALAQTETARSASPTFTTQPAAANAQPQPKNPTPQTSAEAAPIAEEQTPEHMQTLVTVADMSLTQRLAVDPVGNALAILLIAVMLVSLGVVAAAWLAGTRLPGLNREWQSWLFFVLTLAGVGVSVYMAYVEIAHASAVCGPVGDCNTVQQSPYARLFGMLPIGALGVLGYVAFLGLWLAQRFGPPRWSRPAMQLMAVVALFGVAFSLYLTFLEPFVIGAVCMWCLSSALIMTLLLWLLYFGGEEREMVEV